MRLSRQALIRLSCYCRQAERTIDRALHSDWQEVRKYYAAERQADLQCLIELLPHETSGSFKEIALLRSRWETKSRMRIVGNLAKVRVSSLLLFFTGAIPSMKSSCDSSPPR